MYLLMAIFLFSVCFTKVNSMICCFLISLLSGTLLCLITQPFILSCDSTRDRSKTFVQYEYIWICRKYSFGSDRIDSLLSSTLNVTITKEVSGFGEWTKLYIPSTPNNSNETHTFMCLGRTGRFGQC